MKVTGRVPPGNRASDVPPVSRTDVREAERVGGRQSCSGEQPWPAHNFDRCHHHRFGRRRRSKSQVRINISMIRNAGFVGQC